MKISLTSATVQTFIVNRLNLTVKRTTNNKIETKATKGFNRNDATFKQSANWTTTFPFALKKLFVWVRKIVCGWKKHEKNTKKNWGGGGGGAISKILRRYQKNASHTFSIYGNCMISIFFDKLFFSFLWSTIHQNKRKVFSNFDGNISTKCMKLVWLVFLHTLSLWNCMISIFGLWRTTRAFIKNVFFDFKFFLIISGFWS